MPKPKSAPCNYDVVWFWLAGVWRKAYPGMWPEYMAVDALVAKLEKQGWPARRGALSIGPPEGPPL